MEGCSNPQRKLYLLGQLAPRVVVDIEFNPRKRWRFVHDLISKCWRRWMKEFLSTLNTRNKWVDQKRNVAPGDVVLLVDPSNPRANGPKGAFRKHLKALMDMLG